jgi:tetratricopeptide (TPR) repeat protein
VILFVWLLCAHAAEVSAPASSPPPPPEGEVVAQRPEEEDATALFRAGIDALDKGNFSEAEADFVQALDAGGRHAAVYHALGNASWRAGHVGRAIAAWERGRELAPRDGDLVANLDKARKQITDRIDPAPRATPFFWQKALSARESGLLASGLLTFALAVVLVSRIRTISSGLRTAGWIALFGSALLALSTADALRDRSGAIVVAMSVTAKSAVGAAGVDLFVLHEGAGVRVLDESADMSLVGLPDERKGWIASAALVSTDPRAPFPLP